MNNNSQQLVFISYSHEDGKSWCKLLQTHLEGFAWTTSQMNVFVDRKLSAGSELRETIFERIEQTAVAVLLITPSFLKSAFIQREELPRFFARKKRTGMPIIPIIIEPCAWQSTHLGKLLALPEDGQPLNSYPVKEQMRLLAQIADEINQLYVRQIEQNERISIVVADDHEYAVRGMRDIFEDEVTGATEDMMVVSLARNETEVERAMTQFAPDILLLDMAWFRDDRAGLRLIDIVRKLSPRTKIIATSNFPDLLKEAKRKGVATLEKGFTVMTLLNKVREVNSKEQAYYKERALFEGLTEREKEVLALVAEGFNDTEISKKLIVSTSTIKKHVSNTLTKTESRSRTEAAVKAKEHGII